MVPWFAACVFAGAQDFSPVWQLGVDDAQLTPFSQESFGPNSAPGSASIKDDDYYLAGVYPAPVGTLAADEPVANFERAVTSSDPRVRIHFPLPAQSASATSLLRVTVDLTQGGAWINGSIPGFSTHDIAIRMNGVTIATRQGIAWDETLTVQVPATAAGAVAGANTLEVERTGGGAGGYIGFDFLRLEADEDALADADGDGMPRGFEELYGLDDQSAADAGTDSDGDGLDAAAEFAAGTNPTDPDSDDDGSNDSSEVAAGTDPLARDSDGDGLTDLAETTTNSLVADSDGDGFPDGYESFTGADPASGASTPYQFPGGIGFQFICERLASARLARWEPAGLIPLPRWNASAPLPHWVADGVILTGNATGLADNRGMPTTAAVAWSYHFSGNGLHAGDGDLRLLNGMIRTRRTSTVNTPVTLALTGIPYPNHDLIIYPGYIYPGSNPPQNSGLVTLDGQPGTRRWFVADSAPPFSGWREITAADPADIAPGNFIRYRNLSGTSHTITLESLNSNAAVAIHGFQIVHSTADGDGDGITDVDEILNRLNPSVADSAMDTDGDGLSNAAELAAGTDPTVPDTDADGLRDGEESTHGTSPLDPDSDDDGLRDGPEVHATPFATLPTLADSDGDGFSDPVEIEHGSHPRDAASIPPPVPVWDAPNRTWLWRIEPVRVVWNHGQSMTGAIEGDEAMLFEFVAELGGGGWNKQLGIGFRYLNGRLVHRFRAIEGLFRQAGNPSAGFWDSDWSSPPADRSRMLGFAGVGGSDDSVPLAIEFRATQPVAGVNSWTITFSVWDRTQPAAPVVIATKTFTGAVAADAALLDGTAVWQNAGREPGRVRVDKEPGVQVFVTDSAFAPPDADSDGMPDAWETLHALDSGQPADAWTDPDADGLENLREFLAGTHPRQADSDGDGAPDGVEAHQGSNPLDAASMPPWFTFNGKPDDLDGDGLSDSWLLWHGGTPLDPQADDDGDGASNREESLAGTDPRDANSRFALAIRNQGDDWILSWPHLPHKRFEIATSGNLVEWTPAIGLPAPVAIDGRLETTLPGGVPVADTFYQAGCGPTDSDGDGVEDWVEHTLLGSRSDSPDSLAQGMDRPPAVRLAGDALALMNHLQGASAGGGPPGSSEAGTPAPTQAARFLMQATFGPTLPDIARLQSMGYAAWIDDQIALPPSLLQPYIISIKRDFNGPRLDPTYNRDEMNDFIFGNNCTTPWARHAVGAPDQLRQRVAFALSQILVVSRRDANLEEKPEAMTHYYDVLVRHALGNYGDLLQEVTTHPAMGWYLSSAGNQKADPSIPRYPDENYAREIMQLFTIGLWELHPDGTRKTDATGEPIPTYDNGDITEMARVFTGMYFASPYGWGGGGWDDSHFTQPMVMHADRHDFGVKRLPGGFVVPARQPTAENGMQDIRDAVDSLVRHPNTPPFVCKQLIQFLVTDNPSPAYVARVAAVFANDGIGTRGNLSAVVRAILLDPEARGIPLDPAFGKVREPAIRTMHLGRILRLAETHPDFVWWNWAENFQAPTLQEPMNAPSVFNFFTPVYQAPGPIRDQGYLSPGFQIINTYTCVSFPNLLWDYLHDGFRAAWSWQWPLDCSDLLPLAQEPAALVERINLLVCAGTMTAHTRGVLLAALSNASIPWKERCAAALWTAMTSPEGAIQR